MLPVKKVSGSQNLTRVTSIDCSSAITGNVQDFSACVGCWEVQAGQCTSAITREDEYSASSKQPKRPTGTSKVGVPKSRRFGVRHEEDVNCAITLPKLDYKRDRTVCGTRHANTLTSDPEPLAKNHNPATSWYIKREDSGAKCEVQGSNHIRQPRPGPIAKQDATAVAFTCLTADFQVPPNDDTSVEATSNAGWPLLHAKFAKSSHLPHSKILLPKCGYFGRAESLPVHAIEAASGRSSVDVAKNRLWKNRSSLSVTRSSFAAPSVNLAAPNTASQHLLSSKIIAPGMVHKACSVEQCQNSQIPHPKASVLSPAKCLEERFISAAATHVPESNSQRIGAGKIETLDNSEFTRVKLQYTSAANQHHNSKTDSMVDNGELSVRRRIMKVGPQKSAAIDKRVAVVKAPHTWVNAPSKSEVAAASAAIRMSMDASYGKAGRTSVSMDASYRKAGRTSVSMDASYRKAGTTSALCFEQQAGFEPAKRTEQTTAGRKPPCAPEETLCTLHPAAPPTVPAPPPLDAKVTDGPAPSTRKPSLDVRPASVPSTVPTAHPFHGSPFALSQPWLQSSFWPAASLAEVSDIRNVHLIRRCSPAESCVPAAAVGRQLESQGETKVCESGNDVMPRTVELCCKTKTSRWSGVLHKPSPFLHAHPPFMHQSCSQPGSGFTSSPRSPLSSQRDSMPLSHQWPTPQTSGCLSSQNWSGLTSQSSGQRLPLADLTAPTPLPSSPSAAFIRYANGVLKQQYAKAQYFGPGVLPKGKSKKFQKAFRASMDKDGLQCNDEADYWARLDMVRTASLQADGSRGTAKGQQLQQRSRSSLEAAPKEDFKGRTMPGLARRLRTKLKGAVQRVKAGIKPTRGRPASPGLERVRSSTVGAWGQWRLPSRVDSRSPSL